MCVLHDDVRGITDDESMDTLPRKGVYPHDTVNRVERFTQKVLPPRGVFSSRPAKAECSEANTGRAASVRNTATCEYVRGNHDLYVRTAVMVVADVFEPFRTAAISKLYTDRAYNVSGPQHSRACVMKMTRRRLTLFIDPEMLNAVNAYLRGGITMISR